VFREALWIKEESSANYSETDTTARQYGVNRMSEEQNTQSQSQSSNAALSKQEETRLQIFIVDDHPAIREALTSSINSKIDMRVVGESPTAKGALRQMERRKPDVVVVDISLEDAHGLDLVEEIRSRFPDVRVVVFSMYEESVYAERAIRAGASGYVMKSEPTERVVEAIQSVSEGDVFLSQRMSSRILSKVIRQEEYSLSSATEDLTDREMDVFQMLGAGHSMKDIAAELDLSRKTIETYRRRAKEKLGFDTVSELLQYAVQWSYGRGQLGGHDESV
jgi:DNA-binding NarL/FixJ family response regulator